MGQRLVKINFLYKLLLLFLSGCGYTFQTSKNPWFQQHAIEKVYLAPIRNETLRANLTFTLQNEVLRTFIEQKSFRWVSTAELADAQLKVIIRRLSSVGNSFTGVRSLRPEVVASHLEDNFVVPTEYMASLAVAFELWNDKECLWSKEVTQKKPYPSANQVGVWGTTAPLINDSEFQRCLDDIAHLILIDVRESLLGIF